MADRPTDIVEERLSRIPVASLPEPDVVWAAIQGELREGATISDRAQRGGRPVPRWLAAASLVAAAVGGTAIGSLWSYRAPMEWNVVTVAGAPLVGGDRAREGSRLTAGEWLVTDSASIARIAVGRIGHAEIGPDSRLRIERGGLIRHRVSLDRGTMHAVIEAPPRLFLVRAPSALATDLGCAFTLHVDDDGGSRLEVTEGWVELKEHGRQSLVPAGMEARAEVGRPPGTPYPVELDMAARAALARIDAGAATRSDLQLLLVHLAVPADAHNERHRSAMTMWHLLQRTDGEAREAVFERLAELSPPPARTTREGILALDRRMLERWRSDLHPMWSEEAQPIGTRIARRLWDLVIR